MHKPRGAAPITTQELRAARILIVDDEPVNVMLLEKMLASNDYHNVTSTTDSRRALPLYAAQGFDLVLLDLQMPHMDGFQVLEKIRQLEAGSYPPVLVLTANEDRDIRLRALEAGARDFLNKPFDHVELLNRIRNNIEIRLLQQAVRDENRLLEMKVRERTRAIQETQQEIIRRLGRAAEFRDNETGLHIQRMSQMSRLIALAAGLSEQEADLILQAAPMHDIGKIGIPDQVLLKPGKLDAQEWEIMKTHTTIGAKMLAGHPSPLLRTAHDIALAHHERWDGSGYPHGLAGEAIPIQARIVAIADVFDALTSQRPYKQAWPTEEAIAEIQRASASHFDPRLVEAFLGVLPEILQVRDEFAEPAQEEDEPEALIEALTRRPGQPPRRAG